MKVYRFYLEHTSDAERHYNIDTLKAHARRFGLKRLSLRPPNGRPCWPDELKFSGTAQQVNDYLSYLSNHTEHGQYFYAWNENLRGRLIPDNGKPWGGNISEHL